MIYLKEHHINEMISHAMSEYPKEVCGILAGKGMMVENIHHLTNIDSSTTTYFADPTEQFMVMKEIEKRDQRIVAIYHSHPMQEAYPSERDVELAFWPDFLYLIISLRNPKNPTIRAFWIKEGEIREEEIKYIPTGKEV